MMTPDYNIRLATFADAKAIASVHFQTWKTAYKGIIDSSFLEKQTLDDRLLLRNKILTENIGVFLVATHLNKVIAFYDAGPLIFHKNQQLTQDQLKNRKEPGEVYALYVLQEHQHIGIGTALFQKGSEVLNEKGLTPFIVWVLKENHNARAFYKKLGGHLVDETSVKIGENFYMENAYQFI